MSNKLNYDIKERYSYELSGISNKLNQIENNRFYELSKARMDGSIKTNVDRLREMIEDLLNKIQNDEESTSEKMSRHMKDLSKK